jgi:hypothetical protein
MKPRNARVLDDLLDRSNTGAVYQFLRDGSSDDLVEILRGLESRLQHGEARTALVAFASMLIQARPTKGFDGSRGRDHRGARDSESLSNPGVQRAVDEFVAKTLAAIRRDQGRKKAS